MKSVDLVPLALPPGLYKNGTKYQSKGRWFDAQFMRFFSGMVRPIGGRVRMQDAVAGAATVQLAGIPRTAFAYRPNQSSPTDDGPPWFIIGTQNRLYAIVGKQLGDISPLNPIPGTNVAPWPTPTITVTGALELNAGISAGATSATLKGTTTLTGTFNTGDVLVIGSTNILAAGLDVVAVTTVATAAGNLATVSFTPAVANNWAINTNVVYIQGANPNSGSSTTLPQGSFGFGAFGAGQFGVGPQTSGANTNATTWQIDAFGQDAVAVSTNDGHLYYWPHALGTAVSPPTWGLTTTGAVQTSGATAANSPTIAITATTMSGTILHGQQFTISGVVYTALLDATAVANIATVTVSPLAPAAGIAGATALSAFTEQSPQNNRGVVVTPERYIMLLGAGGDARTCQWADRESSTQWGIVSTTLAGAFRLKTNGALMAGRSIRNQTAVWTDADLWLATWIGGNAVYRFDQAGDNCGLIAPNACAVVDTTAYWMGPNGFYLFNGVVQPIPCDVFDYVFGRLTVSQKAKVWALAQPQFGEIWWFYPSTQEIDSYVVYNYREGHWTTGMLARSAGAASNAYPYPVLCDTTGFIWEHENGDDRGGTAAYLESGPIELGNGDNVMSINRVAMDEKSLGDVKLDFYVSYWPPSNASPPPGFNDYGNEIHFSVPQFTTSPLNCRITGRQARIRFTENSPASPAPGGFRIGNMRLGMTQGGTR